MSLSAAKAQLDELGRRVRQQHERFTLTRDGKPEAVLLSLDDLEGREMTLEILGDTDAVAHPGESYNSRSSTTAVTAFRRESRLAR